jgi:hypothetical protein
MDINGYTFYTMTQDKNSVYQNSGVRVRAVVDDSHDDDDDMETDTSGLGIWRLVSSPESKPSSSNTGDTMISTAPLRVGTMRQPIYTPSCST